MPAPEILTSLPNHEQLIPLLLEYDVVGFQTESDSGNFVRYLMSECNAMRDMRVFETSGRQITMRINGNNTRLRKLFKRRITRIQWGKRPHNGGAPGIRKGELRSFGNGIQTVRTPRIKVLNPVKMIDEVYKN